MTQAFALRVVEGLNDKDLFSYLHFLEQSEVNPDAAGAADATYMLRLVNLELERRRRRDH